MPADIQKAKDKKKMIEKPKDTKKTLIRLWGYLNVHKAKLIIAVILAMTGNLLALSGPPKRSRTNTLSSCSWLKTCFA